MTLRIAVDRPKTLGDKMSMKTFLVAIAFSVVSGCGTVQSSKAYSGVIHPNVFAMAESWLSDVAQPVVTEINLDAVARNRNQFDHDGVSKQGGWVHYADPESKGFTRYKFLKPEGGIRRVLFQNNGGGSLTTSTTIGYRIFRRAVITEDGKEEISVLKIELIQ